MRSAGIAGGVITGGYNTEYGGGIYVIGDGACLDLRGGTVYNNHAAYGGGIYAAASNSTSSGNDSATLYIVGGAVRNNIADKSGGGVAMCIVAREKAEIWLSGASEITGNRAQTGGGIYAVKGTLEGSSMGSTVIANNVATEKGGGIYYGSGYMLLNDGGTIEGNTAALGGGIYSAGSSGQTKNVIIRGNTATDLGGGVYVADSSLSIGGSNGIVGNHAYNAGGGVYMEGGKLSAGCADGIHGNDAGANGGGAYVMGGEFTPQYSVADNTLSDGTLNNVYLPQDQLIAQKYSATGAKIGVTTEVLPTRDAPVAVASGSYANDS